MTREFSRQAFLRGALGVATAGVLLGSCRQTAAPDSATSSPSTGPHDWDALDDALEGHVVIPSDPDYATAKGLFNARFADSTPAAVVSVKSTGDVQKAVAFAAEHDVKVTVRSGGHSYVGASAANGAMIIDLRQLPGGIVVDEGSGLATISAAAVLNSVGSGGGSMPTSTAARSIASSSSRHLALDAPSFSEPMSVDTPLSASLLGAGLEERRNELRAKLPIGRVVGPADVAALAVHIKSNTALTGATYDIDGGQQFAF
jgi:hypothetical protein